MNPWFLTDGYPNFVKSSKKRTRDVSFCQSSEAEREVTQKLENYLNNVNEY